MTVEAFTPAELAAAERVLRHLLRTEFGAFVEKTFEVVSPGQPFRPNWHIGAISHALKRVGGRGDQAPHHPHAAAQLEVDLRVGGCLRGTMQRPPVADSSLMQQQACRERSGRFKQAPAVTTRRQLNGDGVNHNLQKYEQAIEFICALPAAIWRMKSGLCSSFVPPT